MLNIGCLPSVQPPEVHAAINWILHCEADEKRQQCRATQCANNNQLEFNGTIN